MSLRYIPGPVSLAGGDQHTCGIMNDGGVYCWGNNDFGQLGSGALNSSMIPLPVLGMEIGECIHSLEPWMKFS